MTTSLNLTKPRGKAAPALALTATTVLATVLSAGAAGAAPAATKPASRSAMNVSISESGSTLLEPLFDQWANGYHKHNGTVTVTPSGGGSGKGISDAIAGTVDIGASDAYVSGSDRSENKGLQDIALAISSQMVNYNIKGLAAGTHLQLSGTVLSAIYQGKITMWDDPQIEALNKGVKLPAEKIVALHRSDSSGDTFLFSTYLSDADPKGWGNSVGYGTSISFPSISNAQGETGNSGMVSGCRTIPGCIAYIGISYKSDTQSAKLGEAALENGDGKYELPTPNTIDAEAAAFTAKTPADEAISMIYGKTPDGYPIINYEYAIVPAKEQNTTVAGAVKGFLEWAVSPSGGNSAMYLGQVGFQPLPAPVLKLSDALITKIS